MNSPVADRVESEVLRTAQEFVHRAQDLRTEIQKVVLSQERVVNALLTAMFAQGHVLIEDVPGVGKTTLAQSLARSLGLAFQRIQFTSDLLPTDIIGVTIFNQKTQAFEFVPGPLFANVVLADEINRATPKTQSALLEAMNDRKVSVDRNVQIRLEGVSRQQIGQFAADLRAIRPPEPYKGKGIRYLGEQVRRKVGKAGAGA